MDAANRDAVGQALPEGSVVRFDLEGPDGLSVWSLVRRSNGVDLVPEQTARPDCQVRCTIQDFEALLQGSLTPREGYLSGRLRVLGDVGIVLEMRRAVLKNRAS